MAKSTMSSERASETSIESGLRADVLKAVSRLSLKERSAWLDSLIKVELSRATQISDLDELFKNVRELQIALGLRFRANEEYPWFLDATRPFMSRVRSTNEEVLPGSFSQSRKHLKFKLDVFHEIARRYDPQLDDHGHPGANAYGHDVSRLLSVSGCIPKEIGVRPLDNRKLRLEHGLSNDMPSDLLAMMDDFLLLMYGKLKPTRVRFESKSQSGLPLRSYGRGYKTLGFIHAVNHLEDVLTLTREGRLEDLFHKYDILYAYLMGSRRQADAAGKKRYITTEADRALGNAGVTLVDNSVSFEGVPNAISSKFSAMRFRMVWGGNIISNAIVNCIGSSARNCYGSRYDFTLKHHGGSDILQKMNDYARRNNFITDFNRGVREGEISVVAIDVTQFDGSYPAQLLMKYADFFKDTAIYDLFLRQMCGVSVQLLVGENSPLKPDVTADPFNFDPMTHIHCGMPSGWSWVSDVGKIMALVVYYALVKAGLLEEHSPAQLHSFMRGELRFAVLNLGDDNVILGPPGTYHTIMDALDQYSPWKCEIEQGTRFIGHIISVTHDGYFQVTHDPSSYLTNLLTPERGIRSSMRKYWAVGYNERKKVYLDAPITVEFSKILQEKWFDNYGTNLEHIINQMASEQTVEMSASTDPDDATLKALMHAVTHAPDRAFAEHVLMRYMADSSVLSWEFSRDEILEKIGIDLYDLESRPDVEYTCKVLSQSGYSVSGEDANVDAEQQYWLHDNLVAKEGDSFWANFILNVE